MSLLLLFPSDTLPTFDAPFLSGVLPAGLTYTNSSTTRTYFGADGLLKTAAANAPIFEYNPLTLALLGMRWEMEQRTNLLLHSRSFTNAAWQGTGLTKTGGQTDASGGTSAVLLTGPSSSALIQSLTTTASGAHTFKIAAKGVSGTTEARFLVRNSTTGTNDVIGVVNPIAGTITSGAGWASRSIGNGFYEYTFTTSITITNGDNLSFYYGQTGNAPSGWNLIVDYAQLEAGSSSSSFIPTTTAAVTRQPDVLTASSISWYRQAEGTMVFEGIASAITAANQGLFVFSNGTAAERIFTRYSTAGNPSLLDVSGNVAQCVIATSVAPAGSVFRHAASYKINNFNAATNGTLGTPDTSGAVASGVNALTFGYESPTGGTGPFMGYARRFQYYNTRLPNGQIQGMSRV